MNSRFVWFMVTLIALISAMGSLLLHANTKAVEYQRSCLEHKGVPINTSGNRFICLDPQVEVLPPS